MVEKNSYIPKRSDVVEMVFNPQVGHEQAGKRPALVLSPEKYNEKTGLIIACPITGKSKGYPFEVELPNDLKTYGIILADQVKSLDWQRRKAKFIEKAPEYILKSVIEKLDLILKG